MCAMSGDLLNSVYITWVDILRIIFYAALPFTVLAQEATKSVWNTWSHLFPGTVNNDLLCNTKLWSQSLYLHKYTQGKSINKKKYCNSYPCVGWIWGGSSNWNYYVEWLEAAILVTWKLRTNYLVWFTAANGMWSETVCSRSHRVIFIHPQNCVCTILSALRPQSMMMLLTNVKFAWKSTTTQTPK